MTSASQTAAQINSSIFDYNMYNGDWCFNNVGSQIRYGGRGKPLKEMTVVELRQVAKQFAITGRSTMKKAELVKTIRARAKSMKR